MGIPTSKSTRNNPLGNGQIERLNRTIWQSEQLALQTKNLPLFHGQYVLSETLRAIRSLYVQYVINCRPTQTSVCLYTVENCLMVHHCLPG